MATVDGTADAFDTLVDDGILVYARPGALPAAALGELIAAVRALDMDQLRAQLDSESSATG